MLQVLGAFGGVRVQQRLARVTGQDEVEFPGEVRGVPDARAHALAGERGHLVSGVSGDQEPPLAPAFRPACLEGVDGVPLEHGVAGVDVPVGKEPPGGLGAGFQGVGAAFFTPAAKVTTPSRSGMCA